ncbi:MAG TPA: CPBP family intramembrane glutamic endopeptidase [Pyrinomonadaceae bacterium]|nr:CPBP family intramembrane glutamic endopeptidase [Pyrinomonadaceae bacterium]
MELGPLHEAAKQGVDRSLAIWEIISVMTSCLIAEWVVTAVAGASNVLIIVPIILAFGFMFWSHRLRGESLREIGLRLDNFGKAARLLIVPMVLASLLLIGVGYLKGSIDFFRWRGGGALLGMPLWGMLWGLVQQYALQGFINRRAQIAWGPGMVSILIVAILFGAFHLPNPALMIATFAGGLVWATVYQRAPNLFALAISHGLMTWILISTLPSNLLHGLRVGYKFIG